MSREFKKFNPRNFKDRSTIVVIGKRETGKSSIIKLIAYYKHKSIRIPFVVSETAEQTGSLDGIVPKLMIHDKFNIPQLELFVKAQREIAKEHKSGNGKWNGKKTDALIILDDILGLGKEWQRERVINNIFMNGRHSYLTTLVGLQDVMAIGPSLRANADYVIVTKVTDPPSHKKLYENYWNPAFGDKKVFQDALNFCTEGHRALVIDNKNINVAANLYDCVFYLEPPHPKYIPPFRLCSKINWDRIKEYEDDK